MCNGMHHSSTRSRELPNQLMRQCPRDCQPCREVPFFNWGDKYQGPSQSQALHLSQKVSQAGAPVLAAEGWQDSGASGCAQRGKRHPQGIPGETQRLSGPRH